MKIIREPRYREEFTHVIEYGGVEYVRKECIMGNDFHVISWYVLGDEEEEIVAYYSNGQWSKDGFMGDNNPIPEIEQIFLDKYMITTKRKNYHYEQSR